MKIEQSLVALRAGQVRRIHCRVGDNVASGAVLVELE
jgi:biotin carboxyl carrier protein